MSDLVLVIVVWLNLNVTHGDYPLVFARVKVILTPLFLDTAEPRNKVRRVAIH